MKKFNRWTGERLETNITNETMLEHLHRYALAMEFTKGKKVLDIACGEGYGTNLMAENAAEVKGVDIDIKIISKAKKKYRGNNIEFLPGSLLNIPAMDKHFDIITSFETLEHISEHEKAISELKRVLHPDGILLISTPEKSAYSDITGYNNPFHQKELYKEEFEYLLKQNFKQVKILGQHSYSMSAIYNEEIPTEEKYFSGNYTAINRISKPTPVYLIAIASDNTLPLINNSYFLHSKKISDLQQDQSEVIQKTLSYRIGNAVLYPFKLIKRLFLR
jgi:ubiquinone/menaquinone biosynthesis C-methylase UbiE